MMKILMTDITFKNTIMPILKQQRIKKLDPDEALGYCILFILLRLD